ncbi:MAG: sulfite exporter TauE/SafE family protein [Betaproteobacteria bacterium]|nr:sulfite exporter TauE/SafE family protein [Betaproteobacteria bacterium]
MPGFESLTPAILVWIVAVIAFAGLVQGALGLGFPIVATPLIALVTDIRTAIIVVLLPCVATVVVSMLRGGPLRPVLARFWMMPVYAFCGAAIGTRLFVAYPSFPFALLLAAMLLVYLNLDRLGRTEWPVIRERHQLFALAFGFLAGLSEGTANVAAPPLVVFYLALGLSPITLVQGLNICFFTGKATQFATLATAGGVPWVEWAATLPLAVVATFTALRGVTIRSRIDAATYRVWLKRALFAMALILLGQYAYGRWVA